MFPPWEYVKDWHGNHLLDDGFYEYLVDEGYIDEPDVVEEDLTEDEEETNCEIGTYDCDSCVLNGKCDRLEAVQKENFYDFCDLFPMCKGCPFEGISSDCEEELWPRMKKAQASVAKPN